MRTNRIIGGNAPSIYIEKIKNRNNIDDDTIEDIVKTHVVEPRHLYNDDFSSFFAYRKEEILKRIEKAMGKTIQREQKEEGELIEEEFAEEEI